MKLTADGNRLSAEIAGGGVTVTGSATDTGSAFMTGKVGLTKWGTAADFDDVKVTAP